MPRNLFQRVLSVPRVTCYVVSMKTILAPIDFSGVTPSVVAQALTLARSIDARVVLLSVIQPPVSAPDLALIEDVAEITAAGEKSAAQNLEKFQRELEAAGVSTETVQFVGSPVAHILEQAMKFEADYIVMGSHGHTALYDLLIGSTTQGVLKHAHCPVVILPVGKARTP
jgi:nucleotide-binding universal stress UspA family protein